MIPSVAIVSQKGGVGKTTSAVGLALGLAEEGVSVLILDADPQGGVIHGLQDPQRIRARKGIYHVLAGEEDLPAVAHGTFVDHLAIVDSGLEHTSHNAQLFEEVFRAPGLLREALQTAATDFQLILIDCPPGLGIVTDAVLQSVSHVLLPLQCEPLSLRTVAQLVQQMLEIRSRAHSELEMLGIVLTMFDEESPMSIAVRDQVFQHFQRELVFRTVVPRDPHLNFLFAGYDDLKELLMDLRHASPGLLAYREIAREIRTLLVRTAAIA